MKTNRGRERQDRYLALIDRFPLRPLKSDEDLDAATKVLDSLTDRLDELAPEEQDYLDILTDIVERYEDETIPLPAVSDQDLLRHLIEAKGVTQTEVAKETGIVVSTISEVLAGRRKLNRAHINRLARYFNVGPGVFAFEASAR
jgi:HTH-type transcriptional regulator/antitoxin HigA